MEANERRRLATEEASRWWIKMDTRSADTLSAEDQRQFTEWLRESPLHVSAMLHVAHVHDALGRFKGWSEVATDGADENDNVVTLRDQSPREESAPRRRSAWLPAALAAGLCTFVVGGAWMWLGRGEVIVTDRAERREVMLSDGSVVRLEPESMVRASMSDDVRNITLVRGRALFHVSKDPNRPFIVAANNTAVRAIGTAFGVEHKKDEIIVTVAEGEVAVRPVAPKIPILPMTQQDESPSAAQPASAGVVSKSVSEVRLTAGKQVIVQSSGSAEPVREVDAERALAWSEGRLVFDGVPLRDVAEEFNRYNHVQLRIEGEDLGQRLVRGVFQASDPETLIAFIGAGAHVSVTYPDRQNIVVAAAP
ncbi:transmembrane sensor [Povalibacter uvarum]|uniref:Transmembrane sensor n=1 Tax=Povalibacter uvarum TaxID=732238 RepID=A0A841HWQ0_9GAMM|nr:FecR domain-containing protein [Povalibacter uvarum]MBB6096338.1 transmembrane sensor [Povalibacter uvarum]